MKNALILLDGGSTIESLEVDFLNLIAMDELLNCTFRRVHNTHS